MKLKCIIKSAFARFRLSFGKTTPLRVTHFITYRCNLKCRFCILPENLPELATDEIKNKMLMLKKMGTLAWGFSGGEPFLRNDLPELLRYAKNKCGFLTSVVTNGTLTEKISEVDGKHLDFLMLSIEGSKEKNDTIRGRGTFDRVINTLQIIKPKGIKTVSFDCVVLHDNLDEIKFIIDLAEEYGIFCGFQPVFEPSTGKEDNATVTDGKKTAALKENIKYLIRQIEQAKNRRIMTSAHFLRYCLNYGTKNFKRNRCYAGLLYCQMEPSGIIRNCAWYGKDSVDDFKHLDKPADECYCFAKCHGEYSSVFSFNLSSIRNVIQKFIY
ncbi:MAG: radical SAM protein [Elusimicrobiota bacterium]